MNNISTEFDGDKLIITIDISDKRVKASGLTKKGTSKLVASSHGHATLDRGFALNLNLTAKKE